MTDKVVSLAAHRTVKVWVCLCGCRSFELRAGGPPVCSCCARPATDYPDRWMEYLPSPPESAPEATRDNSHTATVFESGEFSMRRWLEQVRRDLGDMVLLVAIMKDGAVRTTGQDFETSEQADWLERRLQDIRNMRIRRD